jgi:hypothetical protein
VAHSDWIEMFVGHIHRWVSDHGHDHDDDERLGMKNVSDGLNVHMGKESEPWW